MTYASFKIRLFASLLDCAIGFLLFTLLIYYISQQQSLPDLISAIFLSLIILLNPLFIFFSVLLTYYLGGSLGKLITGLRVVSVDDKKLTFKRILFRQTVGYSFSWIFFGLGYYSIIKDPKKQSWHDQTVGSVVKAKGNMFIIGLAMLIFFSLISVSLLVNSVKSFTNSPVIKEVQSMIEESSKEKLDIPTTQESYPENIVNPIIYEY